MKTRALLLIAILIANFHLMAQTNGFVNAYDSMHQVFSKYYPYTRWKALNWDAVNAEIRPRVLNAAASGDSVAFYIALKSYFDFTHDGHVGFRHGWQRIQDQARYRQIGGSCGFALTLLDDGREVVRLVNPGSPAAIAGIQFGAAILEINDKPVNTVLDTVPVLWAEMIPATLEFKTINQGRFIGRAPVGSTMKVKFLNRGSTDPETATMTAVNDNYLTFNQTSMHPVEPVLGVFPRVLQPSGYGYIKMNNEGGDSALLKQEYNDFKNTLLNFGQQGVKGLVLDFRVNCGGDDALSAAIAGFFHPDTALYEFQTWYNPALDSIEVWPLPIAHYDPQTLKPVYRQDYPPGSLYTEPQTVYYDKPLVVMVNPRSISSGEGIPMMLQKLHRGKVVSFYGTNASFGMCSREHHFFPAPDDLLLSYEYGQSVDRNLKIQLDSDSTMNGGVRPDIRVPLNDTVIDQLYKDSIDVELNYAVKTLTSILGISHPQTDQNAPGLLQPEPNPFSAITRLSYYLPGDGFAELEFCDISGRVLQTLVNSNEKAGLHSITFDGTSYNRGLYFFRLKTGGSSVTRKCIITQ